MARFVISGIWKDKAIKDALKSLQGLTKQTKEFSRITAAAYATASTAAAYYAKKIAKESIRGALDDEKTQRQLAFTLHEVAGASEAAALAAEANIGAMQRTYGIADDVLRPALSKLVRVTQSTTSAFNGLDLALSLSVATGNDLDRTVSALTKAYNGQFRALKGLGLTLDEQKVKNKDLDGILSDLRKTYGEFADNELNTATNQFNKLKVASDQAKDAIGFALIDAIMEIVDSLGGIDKVVKRIEGIGVAIADTVRGVGEMVKVFKNFFASLNAQAKALGQLGAIFLLAYKFGKLLTKLTPWRLMGAAVGYVLKVSKDLGKQQRINASIAAAASKQIISARNAEYLALKKIKDEEKGKKEASDKTVEQLMAEEAARRAGFKITEDIDSIQTVAAAKRLEEARQYKAQVLDAAQAQFEAVKSNYDLLNAVWQTQLTAFDAFLAALKAKSVNIPVNFIGGTMPAPNQTSSIADFVPAPSVPAFSGGMGSAQGGSLALGGQTVNITVNAGAIGSEEFLVGEIGNALTKYTRLGNVTAPAGFM